MKKKREEETKWIWFFEVLTHKKQQHLCMEMEREKEPFDEYELK